MFDQRYFEQLFHRFPILLLFNSPGIHVSTDETQLGLAPAAWCRDMYAALGNALSHDDVGQFPVSPLNKVVKFPQQRSFELERTVLSIMVVEAIAERKTASLLGDKCKLSADNLELLRQALSQQPNLENFLLAMIFADLGKISAVREYFRHATNLQSNDQDVALSHILSQKQSLLCEVFGLSVEQVNYIQTFSVPLHLGHAAQAECTANKFKEFQALMLKQTPGVRKSIVEIAILKQLFDVAGARAQNNGAILLINPIFDAYANLKTALLALISGEAYEKVYWNYATKPLIEKWPTQPFYKAEEATGTATFSSQGVFLRLIRQLRLIEHGDKFQEECQQLKDAVDIAADKPPFRTALASLQKYDETMPHTMTYGPAVYATLYQQATTDKIDIKKYGFSSVLEYTAQVGTVVLGRAVEAYLTAVKEHPALKHSPLCFNQINAQIQQNSIAALQMFAGTRGVKINLGDGIVSCKSNKSHAGCWSKRIALFSPILPEVSASASSFAVSANRA